MKGITNLPLEESCEKCFFCLLVWKSKQETLSQNIVGKYKFK